MANVLLLHPGKMGSSVANALIQAGHEVFWVSQGRSNQTRERAEELGLCDVTDLSSALGKSEFVISVCPPEYAGSLAEEVIERGYEGTYVDANAVSPATSLAMGDLVGENYVDGGIIGPPAWNVGSTRIYLSGPRAANIAALFEGTLLDSFVIEGEIGAASALKMCYAAYTKGSSALLLGVRALAERMGVTDSLISEWAISQRGLEERSRNTAYSTSQKAWRFAGEMREIAATYSAAGLPAGFHEAAAELFERMKGFKDRDPATIDELTAELLRGKKSLD
ncbi:MAG: phosphogluconate dehydrogenase [Gammaproteobacteria bacterium]|nr:phosphogluconate dehydrogenase [Gammaproteobacteria bacterium]